jgi:hypothetical protein
VAEEAAAAAAGVAEESSAPPTPDRRLLRSSVPSDSEENGVPVPDQSKCVLCQGDMKRHEELQSLTCMHMFHLECLKRYSDVKGKPILDCCCLCNDSRPRLSLQISDPDVQAMVETQPGDLASEVPEDIATLIAGTS